MRLEGEPPGLRGGGVRLGELAVRPGGQVGVDGVPRRRHDHRAVAGDPAEHDRTVRAVENAIGIASGTQRHDASIGIAAGQKRERMREGGDSRGYH